MSKKSVGRNDPCPCGSGKKYKKCCLGKDEAQVRLSSSPSQDDSSSPPPDAPVFRPYSIARVLDNPRNLKGMSAAEIAHAKQLWTPRKIAGESTAEIEARLLQYGVPYTREGLRQLISGHESAWTAANPWIDSLKNPERMALDFVGMAVCEIMTPDGSKKAKNYSPA